MKRLILFAVAAAAIVSQPATARSLSVATHDLDLSTSAGRDMLESRIKRAARRVCAINEGVSVREVMAARRCMTAAIDGTRVRVAALTTAKLAKKG